MSKNMICPTVSIPKPCRSRRSNSLAALPLYFNPCILAIKVTLFTRPLLLVSRYRKASGTRSLKRSLMSTLNFASSMAEVVSSSKRLMIPSPLLSAYFQSAGMLPLKPISMHLRSNCLIPIFMFASGSIINHVRTGFPKRRFVKSKNSSKAWKPLFSRDWPKDVPLSESSCSSWAVASLQFLAETAHRSEAAARAVTSVSRRNDLFDATSTES
mmetsp:Transcript_83711/g.148079  ORF Transcript_83711/g.148079 Transcript_83711/m.148079 type:complete len:213 (-) Transcript_83711:251-889(-)